MGARRRAVETRDRPLSADADWKHLVKVGGIVSAVVGTLILAAVLETGPPPGGEGARRLASPAPPEAVPVSQEPEEVPSEVAAATTPLEPLAERAADDYARLAGRSGWTLQFMVACDPANVAPVHAALRDDPSLYLVPTMHDEKACFRVVWGLFEDRAAAAAAIADAPVRLAAITRDPQPLPVERVLE